MALKTSRMLPLGTPVPAFALPDPAGKLWRVDDFASSKALLVIFMCNHCPYVQHLFEGIATFAKDYRNRGLGIVAISANDITTHPQDAPPEMARVAREQGFDFPYLYDESQAVARAYEAVCTPEFYLFDANRRLAYRGQFDASRPKSGIPVTGADLRAATDAVLAGKAPSGDQRPSAGCNIKWKPGQEPDWT